MSDIQERIAQWRGKWKENQDFYRAMLAREEATGVWSSSDYEAYDDQMTGLAWEAANIFAQMQEAS